MFKALIAMGMAVVLGTAAQAATFRGTFWDASGSFDNVSEAMAYAQRETATATFHSTFIDYPNSPQRNMQSTSSLSDFLGTDAASLSGAHNVNLMYSVFHWTGYISVDAGTHRFSVSSDDGFRLEIEGMDAIEYSSPRSFNETYADRTITTGGIKKVDLWFYENRGQTGVEFKIDNSFAAPIPLPAPLLLSAAGIAALTVWARRQSRSS